MAQLARKEPTHERSNGLTRDQLFDVLANERRRCIIQYIVERGERIDFSDLVDHVAAWENEKSVDEVTSAERKRVYSALQQTHLPKMDELGLVEYERESNVVRAADEFTDLRIYLQVVGGVIPYSIVYLSLTGLAIGLWLAQLLSIPVIGTIPALAGASLVVVLFGVASIVHLFYTQKMELVPEFTDLMDR